MPRNLDPRKRQKLLQAALRLFASQTYQATSTAEIASAAGIAAGTLFLYFASKQDLLNELVLEISREQASYVNSRMQAALSVRETFFVIWESSINWLLENLDAYVLIQQIRDTGLLPQPIIEESGRMLGYYYMAVGRGMQDGSLKPYPPELIGGFLYQDIIAVINYARAESNPAHRQEVIQQGFKIFWDGIRL